MQTRSITRKLANALTANSNVSNDCSTKNTVHQRSKNANKDKNNKSNGKTKDTVPADKMAVDVKKRRSSRLMIEEEKPVKNKKKVTKKTSPCSDEPRKTKKKDAAASLTESKKSKLAKGAKDEVIKKVKAEGKRIKEEVKEIKLEKEQDKEEKQVKPEVSEKDTTDIQPPQVLIIEDDANGTTRGVSKNKSVELSSCSSKENATTIKKEVELQARLSDVERDIKKEAAFSETQEFSRSVESKEEAVADEKEQNEMEVEEEEMASTSIAKESNISKPQGTVLQGFDIRIEKLPEHVLNSVREKRLVIGGSRVEEKNDSKKQTKKLCKRKIVDDKNYIPLNSSGSTKFFVADMKKLKKSKINHPAIDVKRDLLYGPRIKRVSYSNVLAYNMKQECRKMRY